MPQLQVETFLWGDPDVEATFNGTLRYLRVSRQDVPGPPAIVIGTDVIGPQHISADRVKSVAEKYVKTGAPPTWNVSEDLKNEVRVKTHWHRRTLGAGLLDAGLRDGYSPWAAGMVVMLLACVRLLDRQRRDAGVAAIVFVASAFAAYFAIGVFFRPALAAIVQEQQGATVANAWQWLPAVRTAQEAIGVTLGLVLLVIACAAFVRYRHLAEGRADGPLGVSARALGRVREWGRRSGAWVVIWIPALLGLCSALIELVFTGRLYGPAVELLMQDETAHAHLPFWVLLYNVGWVTPLVVTAGIGYLVTQSAVVARAVSRHRVQALLIAAVLLLVLSLALLASGSSVGARG